MVHNNGSVSKNVRYQDLCVERFAVNVAYNHDALYFEVENNTRALHNIESIGKLLLLEGILTELKNSTKESLCLQHESALLPSAFARHCSALVCTALHCRGRVCALSFRSNAAFCLDVCPV